uniref:Uncharacterized protein n=1 Tax=Meloidogyne incognita TaxID=6306 RepID=A0A914N7K7_MELIC
MLFLNHRLNNNNPRKSSLPFWTWTITSIRARLSICSYKPGREGFRSLSLYSWLSRSTIMAVSTWFTYNLIAVIVDLKIEIQPGNPGGPSRHCPSS